MRNILLAAGFAVTLTAGLFAQLAPPENLLKNPSFEELIEGVGESPFFAWGPYLRRDKENNPDITAEFLVSGTGAQDGKHAARIEAPPLQVSGALAEWQQRVPAQPETRYYFSVWRRGSTTCAWAAACVEPLTADNKHAGGGVTAIPAEGEKDWPDPEKWQKVEAVFVTGTETRKLHVSLRLQGLGGGWVEYDNAKLIELPKE